MNKLLVIGGSGALGRSIVNTFKKSATTSKQWSVMNIDFVSNNNADDNFVIQKNLTENEIEEMNNKVITSHINNNNNDNSNNNNNKFDCLVNVAGGWIGGDITNESIIDSVRQMNEMNLLSSVLTAHLATKHLKSNSLLVFTGANIIKNQNCGSFMLGYDLSKSSTHRMVDMLVDASNDSTNNSNNLLPSNTKIITILPDTIDTENNRKAMPDSDFTKWTKPDDISLLIKNWAEKNKEYPDGTYYNV